MGGESSSGYRLVRTLASGGMGSVSLVMRREGSFSRLYALKRLHPHLQCDEQLRAMFVDEARFAGLIRHANVVSVLDVGTDAEGPFLVMDYIEGIPLSSLMVRLSQAGEIFPIQICLSIAAQVADGLQAAHELRDTTGKHLRLVHRDVSPQNILVGYDAVVRVVDFGIAKSLDQSSRTATGALKGKLGYMAPEQLRFEEPTQASDLFALGVVSFELLAGRRLYANAQGMDGARRALSEPPPDISDDRPDVPPGVVELLFELLAKQADRRPDSAREVARRLRAEHAALVAEEGLLELEDFLETHLGEARRASQLELQGLLRALDAEPRESAAPVAGSRGVAQRAEAPLAMDVSATAKPRRNPTLLALGVGVLLSIGGATYVAMGSKAEPSREDIPVGKQASESVSPAVVHQPAPAIEEAPAPSAPDPARASDRVTPEVAPRAAASASAVPRGAARVSAPKRSSVPRSKPSPQPDPAADFERFH